MGIWRIGWSACALCWWSWFDSQFCFLLHTTVGLFTIFLHVLACPLSRKNINPSRTIFETNHSLNARKVISETLAVILVYRSILWEIPNRKGHNGLGKKRAHYIYFIFFGPHVCIIYSFYISYLADRTVPIKTFSPRGSHGAHGSYIEW